MKKLLIIFCTFFTFSIQAQYSCGFTFENSDPDINTAGKYADFESNYQSDFAINDPTYTGNYVVKTVIHVLHNGGEENISDVQIIDGLNKLNDYFGANQINLETGIRFELYCIKRLEVEETSFPIAATSAGWRDVSFFDRL